MSTPTGMRALQTSNVTTQFAKCLHLFYRWPISNNPSRARHIKTCTCSDWLVTNITSCSCHVSTRNSTLHSPLFQTTATFVWALNNTNVSTFHGRVDITARLPHITPVQCLPGWTGFCVARYWIVGTSAVTFLISNSFLFSCFRHLHTLDMPYRHSSTTWNRTVRYWLNHPPKARHSWVYAIINSGYPWFN